MTEQLLGATTVVQVSKLEGRSKSERRAVLYKCGFLEACSGGVLISLA
jgi:hypothetical protein